MLKIKQAEHLCRLNDIKKKNIYLSIKNRIKLTEAQSMVHVSIKILEPNIQIFEKTGFNYQIAVAAGRFPFFAHIYWVK